MDSLCIASGVFAFGTGIGLHKYIRPLWRPSTQALMTIARRGLVTSHVPQPPVGLSSSSHVGLTYFHRACNISLGCLHLARRVCATSLRPRTRWHRPGVARLWNTGISVRAVDWPRGGSLRPCPLFGGFDPKLLQQRDQANKPRALRKAELLWQPIVFQCIDERAIHLSRVAMTLIDQRREHLLNALKLHQPIPHRC